MWILKKLEERDYQLFEFDLPVTFSTRWSDSILLEKIGYIKITLGKTDAQNVLHLVKMPTYKELEERYLLRQRGIIPEREAVLV